MEEAAEPSNYQPRSFKSPKKQEYIAILWDAFETSYTHGKYQLAVLAYHMLTMSFVYRSGNTGLCTLASQDRHNRRLTDE